MHRHYEILPDTYPVMSMHCSAMSSCHRTK
ncbi:Uncharacterised protein [Vibrio cholerae]|nr:Uncharacterised protein [Vibrio cholerae]CSI59952.1 Uncharacterised protein [Vibrio cholerae]